MSKKVKKYLDSYDKEIVSAEKRTKSPPKIKKGVNENGVAELNVQNLKVSEWIESFCVTDEDFANVLSGQLMLAQAGNGKTDTDTKCDNESDDGEDSVHDDAGDDDLNALAYGL